MEFFLSFTILLVISSNSDSSRIGSFNCIQIIENGAQGGNRTPVKGATIPYAAVTPLRPLLFTESKNSEAACD